MSALIRTLGPVLYGLLFLALATPSARAASPEDDSQNEKAKAFFNNEKYYDAARTWEGLFLNSSGEEERRIAHNLAIAYQKLGQDKKVFHYLSYEVLRAPSEEDAASLQSAVDFYRKRLSEGRGYFQIGTLPDRTSVCIQDGATGSCFKAPLFWFFEPGEHRIQLKGDGLKTQVITINIREGDNPPRLVEMTPVDGAPIPDPPPVRPWRTKARKWRPWILAGVGVASIAAGASLGFWSESRIINEDFRLLKKCLDGNPPSRSDISKSDNVYTPFYYTGIALASAGGAMVVGGLIWAALDRTTEISTKSTAVSPLVIPGGGGLSVEVGF